MGRKLAGGTMPNDRSLRLFLRFPSTLDRDVLFIIMKDTSTILFNPKITRSTPRRVWSESEPKQRRSKGEVYTFDLFRKIRTYGEVENEWTRERERGRNPFFEGSEACLHCDAKERDHVFRWELPALEIARLPLKLARRRTIGLITGHLSADLALPFLLLFFPTRGSLCDSCSRGCFSI